MGFGATTDCRSLLEAPRMLDRRRSQARGSWGNIVVSRPPPELAETFQFLFRRSLDI